MYPTKRFAFGQPDDSQALQRALKGTHTLEIRVHRRVEGDDDDYGTIVSFTLEGCFTSEQDPLLDPNALAVEMIREFVRRTEGEGDGTHD